MYRRFQLKNHAGKILFLLHPSAILRARMSKLLLIDDEEDVRYSIQRIFDSPEIELATAASGEEGLKVIPKFKPDLVLMDVRMTGMTGLETLRRIRQSNPKLLVILMTAYGTTQTAIEAMKLGAYDYLLKPFDIPKLKEIVGNALKAARDMKQVVSYQPLLESEDYEQGIVGRSEPMQQVFKLIGQVAVSDATALVTGESGTGKELVARAIYHHSNRSEQPFLAVNCAAIPEQLLESELFGHEKGSFTGATVQRIGKFEQCNHGTIFLDEIGDMTPATQTKILRVLQNGTFERVGGNSADSSGRAHHRRDEQAARSRRRRETVPRGFVLPAQRRAHPDSAAARPARGHSAAGELFSEKIRARTAARAEIHRRQRHQDARKIPLARQRARTGERHPPRARHGQERRDFAGRPAAGNFRPRWWDRRPCLSAAYRLEACPTTDAAALARQLFQWARRDPKLKIIPAVERELVMQALKETERQPGSRGEAAGHHARHAAQTHREIRHPARVECEVNCEIELEVPNWRLSSLMPIWRFNN